MFDRRDPSCIAFDPLFVEGEDVSPGAPEAAPMI